MRDREREGGDIGRERDKERERKEGEGGGHRVVDQFSEGKKGEERD